MPLLLKDYAIARVSVHVLAMKLLLVLRVFSVN